MGKRKLVVSLFSILFLIVLVTVSVSFLAQPEGKNSLIDEASLSTEEKSEVLSIGLKYVKENFGSDYRIYDAEFEQYEEADTEYEYPVGKFRVPNDEFKPGTYVYVMVDLETKEIVKTYTKPSSALIVPGRSIFNDSILYSPETVELKAGETKEADLILETKGDGPGKVTYTLLGQVKGEYSEEIISTPDGLLVTIEPSEFTAYPNKTYTSVIRVETSQTVQSGEYHFYFSTDFKTAFKTHFWLLVKVS